MFKDLDAHVVDHLDDFFNLIRIGDVLGKVVINLGIGQVSLLLAFGNELFEARLMSGIIHSCKILVGAGEKTAAYYTSAVWSTTSKNRLCSELPVYFYRRCLALVFIGQQLLYVFELSFGVITEFSVVAVGAFVDFVALAKALQAGF